MKFCSRHLDSKVSCAQTKNLFFFPQTNCKIKTEEPECIVTTLSNSILAPVYPSCLKLSARAFHPFLSHSLLATLPASHPLLGIIFSLIPSVQQGNKMGLINSKRTSVCIAKVDVIKDLMPPSPVTISTLPWTKPAPFLLHSVPDHHI